MSFCKKFFLQHDNSEIQRMEKQLGQIEEKINRHMDDLQNLESDLDESHLKKMRQLRQTEEKFKNFLEAYPAYVNEENARMAEKEAKNAEMLSEISKIIQVTQLKVVFCF